MTRNKTAIGIFLKYPEPGRVKTRLGAEIGNERAAEYYRLMLGKVLEVASRTPYEIVLLCDSYRARVDYESYFAPKTYRIEFQSEGDLGARLRHAFDSLLGRFERVIVIGTDCIDLTPEIFHEAATSDSPLVLGPATDGGYYLIALNRAVPSLFEGIAWSTGTVLAETLDRARAAEIVTHLLPTLSDVDTYEDLVRSGLAK